MSYKVLYRKYRPKTFDEVVGQEYTTQMLKNAINNEKTSHAYLFTGPRGTGKTSSAKIFAKALNCENNIDGNPCNNCRACNMFVESPDIIELDAASNNSVDDIREIVNNVKLVPSNLKYKIYIIDEVHMLSPGAFNALLLTLEEPPSHVVFILATTEIQKVPITIQSRCQRFDFKPVNAPEMIKRLKEISNEEKIKIDEDALEEIALISAGGMRDALGILDQLSAGNKKITAEIVSQNFGSVSKSRILEIINNVANGETEKLVKTMNDIEESGTNYEVFLDKLIYELRNIAIELKSGSSDLCVDYEDIYNMIVDLNELLGKLNINVNPFVLIEIVLLRYLRKDYKSEILTNNVIDVSKNYFPGNNLSENDIQNNNNSGNNFGKSNEKGNNSGNNQLYLGNKLSDIKEEMNFPGNNMDEDKSSAGTLGNNVTSIDVMVRINNCFVDVSMEEKKNLMSRWVDFMNFLMGVDRNLVSILADTIVLASSANYSLIQSKNSNTNDLINMNIKKLEKHFNDFSGSYRRFAAINDELWKKEVEKYRLNRKNKIKYNYIEEEVLDSAIDESETIEVDDIERVAMEIFDTYEVE